MDARNVDLVLIAQSLRLNETTRTTCPACWHTDGFTLTRTAPTEARYICHRASCGAKGVVVFDGAYVGITQAPKPRDTAYAGPLRLLSDDIAYRLADRYELLVEDVRSRIYDAGYPWVAMNVQDADGVLTARMLRYSWLEANPPVPKTKLFLEGERRSMAWYGAGEASVVLTEDCLSALRINRLAERSAAALLGANFGAAQVAELQRAGIRHVRLALDPDATNTAFEIARKWAPAFSGFVVTVMERDPKDTPQAELQKIFS